MTVDNPADALSVSDERSAAEPLFEGSRITQTPRFLSLLPWIFLVFGAILVTFLAVWTPPFQSPDELVHFKRSYQMTEGEFLGGNGGTFDAGIDDLYAHYAELPFHSQARVNPADEQAAADVRWTGHRVRRSFSNPSTYPPIGYLPQAAGIVIGRVSD